MIRSVSLLTAAALAALSAPAFAQDDSYDQDAPLLDDAYYAAPESDEVESALAASGMTRGYSPEQRETWLAQCRGVYYDGRSERRGEVIGGVIGGVAGAVAGNRILDDSRLAGTVIGGSVGVIAGSAIGGAIGEANDRERYDAAARQCEDYLLSYEQSFAGAVPAYGPQGYAYGSPGVAWVRVPTRIARRVIPSRQCPEPGE